MNPVEQYRKQVAASRTRANVGYYTYKARPVTNYGKHIVAELIESKVNKQFNFFSRLFNNFDAVKMASILSEENYKLVGFNGKFEVAYFEVGPSGKTIAKHRLLNEIVNSTHRISLHDIEVELIEYVPYPPAKELDYDDILDLQNPSEGGN